MTNISLKAPAQTSRFNSAVISILTGATIAMAAVLSLAPYYMA